MGIVNFSEALLDPFISSVFDPAPVQFRRSDEVGTAVVRRACNSDEAQPARLRRPLNRNAFLLGCLDYTEDDSVEHLIVGLGTKRASTTRVAYLCHDLGNESAVSVPAWIEACVSSWLGGDARAEVVLFHNHPLTSMNQFLDNEPIASQQDRKTLSRFYLQALVGVDTSADVHRVKLYLGENGFVRQFTTPNLLALLRLGGLAQVR